MNSHTFSVGWVILVFLWSAKLWHRFWLCAYIYVIFLHVWSLMGDLRGPFQSKDFCMCACMFVCRCTNVWEREAEIGGQSADREGGHRERETDRQRETYVKPRSLQTTLASKSSQPSSHTVPHTPSICTSTLPAVALPFTSRTFCTTTCWPATTNTSAVNSNLCL